MPIVAIPSDRLDHEGRGYPRPQLRRETWYSLNGTWEFAFDADGVWQQPDQVAWTNRIRLPFAPDATRSGVGHTGFFRACWYRTRCDLPARDPGERWLLHFGAIGVEVWLDGDRRPGLRLGVKLRSRGVILAADTYDIISAEVHRGIALSDPGIDDSRNELLWSPHSPNLIDVSLELWGGRGELLDTASSYTALRSVAVQGDRFLLNGRPYPLRMVLDQGYWPDGGITAPDDRALRRDVEPAREMGFNAVRNHEKIEDPRYLFWADTIGLAVWEEMPSAYRFAGLSVERLCDEWRAVLRRDYSHPCIVAWVPINESWGVPNLPDNLRERHYAAATAGPRAAQADGLDQIQASAAADGAG